MEKPIIEDICTIGSTESLEWAIDRLNAVIANQAKIAEVLARHGLVELEFDLPDLPRRKPEDQTAQTLALQPSRFEENNFKS